MRGAAIIGLGSSTGYLQRFARNPDTHLHLGWPARASDVDAILVFGGDGTVHRHLAQLVQLQLPVLVVPCGSGNDFARALKLQSVRDAVDAWNRFVSGEGNVRQIDLGMIAPLSTGIVPALAGDPEPPGRYFCCVGGIGLDVEIARRANQLPRWIRRNGGYLLSLPPALLSFEVPAVKVQTPRSASSGGFEAQHSGPAMVVAFANTLTYGGGIRIAPDAQLDDGKLDVCVVAGMAKTRLLRLFPSVCSGRHLGLPEVNYFQAKGLRIESETPVEVYADGEYVCHLPVEVKIAGGALRVIEP